MINNITRYKRYSFVYTNYKGKKETRDVSFNSLQYGHSEYHKKDQWFWFGYCHDREAMRSFALSDIEIASIRELD